MDKQFLITLGAALWPYSYAKTEDNITALNSAVDSIGSVDEFSPENLQHAKRMLNMLNTSSPNKESGLLGIVIEVSTLWYHSGLPQISIGHKYAAALLATKVPTDCYACVEPPFRAFCLTLPVGLVVRNLLGEWRSVNTLYVARTDDKRWTYIAIDEKCAPIYGWRFAIDNLVDATTTETTRDMGAFGDAVQVTTTLQRTVNMIGRLILNVCLAMSDPRNIIKQPPQPFLGPRHHHNSRQGKLPATRNYVVGAPVKIDCRKAVSDYIRTGKVGKALSVQCLVAGHWKMQPHGPNRELRKAIHIEPYWRGAVDAPIAVRNVELVNKAG